MTFHLSRFFVWASLVIYLAKAAAATTSSRSGERNLQQTQPPKEIFKEEDCPIFRESITNCTTTAKCSCPPFYCKCHCVVVSWVWSGDDELLASLLAFLLTNEPLLCFALQYKKDTNHPFPATPKRDPFVSKFKTGVPVVPNAS